MAAPKRELTKSRSPTGSWGSCQRVAGDQPARSPAAATGKELWAEKEEESRALKGSGRAQHSPA